MEENILDIFKKCNLEKESINEVNGMHVPREIFLNDTIYDDLKENIKKLKSCLCSSSITSLHKNAELKQSWPLLNLVRQLLKIKDYKMIPYKKSNGYAKDGTKLYRRFFVIEKINSEESTNTSSTI